MTPPTTHPGDDAENGEESRADEDEVEDEVIKDVEEDVELDDEEDGGEEEENHDILRDSGLIYLNGLAHVM